MELRQESTFPTWQATIKERLVSSREISTQSFRKNRVQGYSFWTFSDLFEETYFPSVPFHGGFGLLNIHGIAKPAYRAYELLHHVGTELLQMEGSHPTIDAWIIVNGQAATILLTNYALPRHPTAVRWIRNRGLELCVCKLPGVSGSFTQDSKWKFRLKMD